MRLVYKKSWKIQQCWCINGFYEATITGCIYLVDTVVEKTLSNNKGNCSLSAISNL